MKVQRVVLISTLLSCFGSARLQAMVSSQLPGMYIRTIASVPAPAADSMIVHFVNVGQGAAALLEFPCGAMLIDAGGQDDEHVEHLIDYLNDFFRRRSDLNSTLESIIISHQHIDHTKALRRVVETFSVKRLLDNSLDHGSGIAPVRWVRENAQTEGRNIRLIEVLDSQVSGLSHRNGLTNEDIDPITCTPVDPEILVLSGGMDENPGWNDGDFENGNNHSLVVKIIFGKASFLFTGDLEDTAIETMVEWYEGTTTLDVDVYHVGHHGSHNGTTELLLDAMTPKSAVISMGCWDFGRGQPRGFNTYSFGHPRKVIVDLLTRQIAPHRAQPKNVKVATKARRFVDFRVTKAIFATGWDDDIQIEANSNGDLDISTHAGGGEIAHGPGQ